MKTLSSKLVTIATATFLFVGCAGITDSNLADLEFEEIETGLERQGDDTIIEDDNNPPVTVFGGGVREDIVIVRPVDEDEDDRD